MQSRKKSHKDNTVPSSVSPGESARRRKPVPKEAPTPQKEVTLKDGLTLPEDFIKGGLATDSLTKDEINQFPLVKYRGKIVLVTSEPELEAALQDLRREKILGFDTETKPSFRKGTIHNPSLIQLAGSETVYLFLLRKFPLGPELAGLLSDPAVLKVGVAIRDDMRFLAKLYEFKSAGAVDLSDLARKNGLGVYGLRPLAAKLLGVRISKSARCSNWNNAELTEQQVSYAATDAWISRQIFMRMTEMGLNVKI